MKNVLLLQGSTGSNDGRILVFAQNIGAIIINRSESIYTIHDAQQVNRYCSKDLL